MATAIKTDLSKVTEPQIKKIDKDTAIRYKVVSEKIDLKALKQELQGWKEMEKPSIEELKSLHPYYEKESRIKELEKKIAEIENG